MKRLSNKIKSLVLVCAASIGFASCGDFLQIEPLDRISEDNFWNEKADIDQMVAGVYVKMQSSAFIGRCIVWGESRADNIIGGNDYKKNIDIYNIMKENLLPSNGYADYASFYSVIAQCNVIIERAPEVHQKDPSYTESDVRATQAEMIAIRDLCYFYLVRAFKDVPYYTQAIQSDGELIDFPASNGDSIVRVMIPELEGIVNDALKAYPEDFSITYNTSRNRITQNAIYSLLSDLCLWDQQYQKCVDYCQKVIDSKVAEYNEDYSNSISETNGSVALFKHPADSYAKSGFPLYPCFSGNSYGSSFNALFGGNQSSFESIFELAFTNQGSSTTLLNNGACADLYGHWVTADKGNGMGRLKVSEDIVGDVKNKSWQIYDHAYDARFWTDIRPEDENYVSGWVNKNVAEACYVDKASGSTDVPFSSGNIFNTLVANRNWIFYRLTDVMLMQAEALIQLGANDLYSDQTDELGNVTRVADPNLERAFYLIWAVNRRSIMVNTTISGSQSQAYELNITKYNNKEQLLELCMKERRRELMFEGKRWFDMLRRCHDQKTTQYIRERVGAKGTTGGSTTLFVNYESLYWPYSKTEIINNPSLQQKPYYANTGEDGNYESTVK